MKNQTLARYLRSSGLLLPVANFRLLLIVWAIQLVAAQLLVIPIGMPLSNVLNRSLAGSQMTGFFGDPMMLEVILGLQSELKGLGGAYVALLPIVILIQIFCHGSIFALLAQTDALPQNRSSLHSFVREGGARFTASIRASLAGIGMTLVCLIPWFMARGAVSKVAQKGLEETPIVWLQLGVTLLGLLLFLFSRVWLDLTRARMLGIRQTGLRASVLSSAQQLLRQPLYLTGVYALSAFPWVLLALLFLAMRMVLPEPGRLSILLAFLLGQLALLCRLAATLTCTGRSLFWTGQGRG